ncbi:hypothetical protein TNCV_5042491 [Trichonephila clavipes]|nr:hypothetical protein TNCV_5042491 [Trichonephila clavipes]
MSYSLRSVRVDCISNSDKAPSQDERAGQFTGPPHPIHRPGYAVSNALRPSALKCAGARDVGTTYEPLCWLKHFAVELYILTCN